MTMNELCVDVLVCGNINNKGIRWKIIGKLIMYYSIFHKMKSKHNMIFDVEIVEKGKS